jgi:acetylornithine deacetylase
MTSLPDEIALLRELVAIPSLSGGEEAIARQVETAAHGWDLPVLRDDASVSIELRGKNPGPTLALVSHLDVVPPGEGWSRDPFTPVMMENKLFGRGSGDAKASVAAMLCAARDLAAAGSPASGRLLLIFGYSEETRNTTMPEAVKRLGPVDAAVVGEPTSLQLATAQRGQMMVDLTARGEQRHAAHPDQGGGNAIVKLAQDLLRLDTLFRGRPHPGLGDPSVTVTRCEAGIGRNITPPAAKALLDVRSTPAWSHAELADGLRAALHSEVVIASDRLIPCATPENSRLLAAALRVNPEARQYGSPTCSDWVFLRHCDAFKCGPGSSSRSHTVDECVDLAEVTAARNFYARLAAEYLQ